MPIQIEQRFGLTEQDLTMIRQLEQQCLKADLFPLKLNWDMLESRDSGVGDDFLAFDGESLVGFVGLYAFPGSETIEVSGMVHPDCRQNGVFRLLAERVKAEALSRGAEELLYICPSASIGAIGYAKSRKLQYTHTEHLMRYDSTAAAIGTGDSPSSEESIALIPASKSDLARLIDLMQDGFGMSELLSRPYLESTLESTTDHTYMAHYKGEPIGTIRLMKDTHGAGIFGFVVDSAHRGRGLGRAILKQTVSTLIAEGYTNLWLEVNAVNDQALRLYESCGFRPVSSFEYYSQRL
ncbi:GNAT family N-acetyltransferase [Paenibacillus turpanensis]|uniref:GNAT family N-acetyltransferase n=1 Tax=Paenibacillus turpanensis TaxID=2689078 RepID=UPI00140B59A2|nr:GNAT family N-acetyltransferase [Paenibacillus turpanensis]